MDQHTIICSVRVDGVEVDVRRTESPDISGEFPFEFSVFDGESRATFIERSFPDLIEALGKALKIVRDHHDACVASPVDVKKLLNCFDGPPLWLTKGLHGPAKD